MKIILMQVLSSALAMITIIAFATNQYHLKFNWIYENIYDLVTWPKGLSGNSIINQNRIIVERKPGDDNFTVDYLMRFRNKDISNISTLKFDSKTQNWVRIKNRKVDNTVERLDSFKMISYNIWFGKHNFLNRRNAIFDLLKEKDADVVCLQEVTSYFFNALIENQFIRENYYISDSYITSYNVVILSKFSLKFYVLTLPTQMNRNLVIGELKVKEFERNKNIVFASSHYESLENEDLRKTQLENSFEVLNSFSNSLLVGDFNIDDKLQASEIKNIDLKYYDSWLIWKNRNNLAEEDGYTYYEDKSEPAQRIDRIMLNKDSYYKLNDFEIFGKEKIQVDEKFNFGTIETPSDHQGLYAEFVLEN